MMNKYKKKLIAIICIVVIIIGAIFIYQHVERQREIAIEQQQIRSAYFRLNVAFSWDSYWLQWRDSDSMWNYIPLELVEYNPFEVCANTYLLLRLYYRETGITLAYEIVADYFLQEFEPDGSLRLYNNGKHPEIQAYVEWVWEGRRQDHSIVSGEFGQNGQYWRRIWGIYTEYALAHSDAGFIEQRFFELSPQMLDALARAELDPDYVLDLTSIQQAGY